MKKFYKVFLWLIILVGIPNLILGTWYEIYHDNKTLEKITDIITYPEILIFIISLILIGKVIKFKWSRNYLFLPVLYASTILLYIITGIVIGAMGMDVNQFTENIMTRWIISIFAGCVYIIQIIFAIKLLRKKFPNDRQQVMQKKEKDIKKGIGGFLAFFVVTLAATSLLQLFQAIKVGFSSVINPLMSGSQPYVSNYLLTGAFVFIASLFAYAFYCLIYKKTNALFTAKAVLFLLFFFNFIDLIFSYNYLSTSENPYSDLYLIYQVFLYPIVWLLYLTLSSRVKNTYSSTPKQKIWQWRNWYVLTMILYLLATYLFVIIDKQRIDKSILDVPQWQEFNSIDKNFSLKFPLPPEQDRGVLSVRDFGRSIEYDYYYSQDFNENLYMFFIIKYPDGLGYGSDEKDLEVAYNALFADESYKLLNHSNDKFKEWSSYNFKVEDTSENDFVQGRFIMINNTVYGLMESYNEDTFDQYDYDNFMDSLYFGIKEPRIESSTTSDNIL